jgi:hypothetical protein
VINVSGLLFGAFYVMTVLATIVLMLIARLGLKSQFFARHSRAGPRSATDP